MDPGVAIERGGQGQWWVEVFNKGVAKPIDAGFFLHTGLQSHNGVASKVRGCTNKDHFSVSKRGVKKVVCPGNNVENPSNKRR